MNYDHELSAATLAGRWEATVVASGDAADLRRVVLLAADGAARVAPRADEEAHEACDLARRSIEAARALARGQAEFIPPETLEAARAAAWAVEKRRRLAASRDCASRGNLPPYPYAHPWAVVAAVGTALMAERLLAGPTDGRAGGAYWLLSNAATAASDRASGAYVICHPRPPQVGSFHSAEHKQWVEWNRRVACAGLDAKRAEVEWQRERLAAYMRGDELTDWPIGGA